MNFFEWHNGLPKRTRFLVDIIGIIIIMCVALVVIYITVNIFTGKPVEVKGISINSENIKHDTVFIHNELPKIKPTNINKPTLHRQHVATNNNSDSGTKAIDNAKNVNYGTNSGIIGDINGSTIIMGKEKHLTTEMGNGLLLRLINVGVDLNIPTKNVELMRTPETDIGLYKEIAAFLKNNKYGVEEAFLQTNSLIEGISVYGATDIKGRKPKDGWKSYRIIIGSVK